MKIPRIGGVVVLYNPKSDILENLNYWISQCDDFVIVDNSPHSSFEKLNLPSEHKILYLHEASNVGIAKALNLGCQELLSRDCDWVLTLDQDSKAVEGMVAQLIELYQKQSNNNKIGLLSPLHELIHSIEPIRDEIENPYEVMTSGNLVNLQIWNDLGGFDDALFIDCVDTDYCLKLKLNGFLIMKANTIMMPHCLGDRTINKIIGRTYYPTHHNALRRYYMTRNRLLMIKRYKKDFPEFTAEIHRNIFREWMMIWLFEKSKWQKNKMILKGYIDFYKGKLGKYT